MRQLIGDLALQRPTVLEMQIDVTLDGLCISLLVDVDITVGDFDAVDGLTPAYLWVTLVTWSVHNPLRSKDEPRGMSRTRSWTKLRATTNGSSTRRTLVVSGAGAVGGMR